MSIFCQCSCTSEGSQSIGLISPTEVEEKVDILKDTITTSALDGFVGFNSDIDLPLSGSPLRSGELYHLLPDGSSSLRRVTLSLFSNGIRIQPLENGQPPLTMAWSPFSLVQACRLHTVQADARLSWLRLFKISVFQHGATHFFAIEGDDADTQRARWCADVSRSMRVLTQSLFPDFTIRSSPLPGAVWTATRILAGYLLLCDDNGVLLAYVELHAHWESTAIFAAYEDETCTRQVVRLGIDQHTCVSERVGIDCGCFSFEGYHFAARTCSEKMLWLRCISNLKTKLRHRAPNPSPKDLEDFRSAVEESARGVRVPEGVNATRTALLPRRHMTRQSVPPPGAPAQAISGPVASPVLCPPSPCEGGGATSCSSRLQQLPTPTKLRTPGDTDKEDSELPSPGYPSAVMQRPMHGPHALPGSLMQGPPGQSFGPGMPGLMSGFAAPQRPAALGGEGERTGGDAPGLVAATAARQPSTVCEEDCDSPDPPPSPQPSDRAADVADRIQSWETMGTAGGSSVAPGALAAVPSENASNASPKGSSGLPATDSMDKPPKVGAVNESRQPKKRLPSEK